MSRRYYLSKLIGSGSHITDPIRPKIADTEHQTWTAVLPPQDHSTGAYSSEHCLVEVSAESFDAIDADSDNVVIADAAEKDKPVKSQYSSRLSHHLAAAGLFVSVGGRSADTVIKEIAAAINPLMSFSDKKQDAK